MDENALEGLIHSAAAKAREALGPHPPAEHLVAYHLGEVAGADADALQEHLALCRECAALVLGAEEFLRADDESIPVDARRGELASPSPRAGVSRAWAYSGWGLAAATLIATTAALLVRPAPVANVYVTPLEPLYEPGGADDVERAAREAPVTSVGATASNIVLVLGVPYPAPALPARAEISVEGRPGHVASVEGLLPQADGAIAFSVPRPSLPPGRYRVRLFGAAPSAEPAAEYVLNLSQP